MTQRTYLEEIPRDITNFMKPYIEGDLPTYRKIATEIYDKVLAIRILDSERGIVESRSSNKFPH